MKSNINIKINEFGPIKNTEISFAPLMIFTGNSSLGKSYVNYIMYYLTSSLTERRGLLDELVAEKMKTAKEQTFYLTMDEVCQQLTKGCPDFMRDFLGNPSLICDIEFHLESLNEPAEKGVKIKLGKITDEMKKKLFHSDIHAKEMISLAINDNEPFFFYSTRSKEESIAYHIQQYIQRYFWERQIQKSIILPPARGSFVGENFSFKEKIATSAGMYSLFLNDYDFGLRKPLVSISKSKQDTFFKEQIKRLTGGDLISEKGIQYLVLETGYKLPLTAAASSIRELSPLLFYMKNWGDFKLSICIEEPEAHLHPEMQVAVADLLATCINKKMFVQLTTHSDYFLQRINQLLKLGDIRELDKSTFTKISEEKKQNVYLNHTDIHAYYFYVDKDKNVQIQPMPINEEGIPFSSFFKTVKDLSDEDEYLTNQLSNLEGKA